MCPEAPDTATFTGFFTSVVITTFPNIRHIAHHNVLSGSFHRWLVNPLRWEPDDDCDMPSCEPRRHPFICLSSLCGCQYQRRWDVVSPATEGEVRTVPRLLRIRRILHVLPRRTWPSCGRVECVDDRGDLSSPIVGARPDIVPIQTLLPPKKVKKVALTTRNREMMQKVKKRVYDCGGNYGTRSRP